jgi:hypothetical protein
VGEEGREGRKDAQSRGDEGDLSALEAVEDGADLVNVQGSRDGGEGTNPGFFPFFATRL